MNQYAEMMQATNERIKKAELELSANEDLPIILEAVLDLQSIAIKKHGSGYTIINMEPEIEYLTRGKSLIVALSEALNILIHRGEK